MQFTIKKQHLLKSIQAVGNAISSRTVIPILTGMKIESAKDQVTLTGSNSDISIQTHIPHQIGDEDIVTHSVEGSIVLPVPHFPEIIKKLPEDLVEITTDDNLMTTIKSGSAKFTLNGQSSSEYPNLPLQKKDTHLQIKKSDLKALIKQTVFAVSTMETRPILTGVHIVLEEKKLTFTATDSHRLSQRSISVNEAGIDQIECVIPGKSLSELDKILNDSEELINITMLDNQVLFHTEQFFFLSRLLSGNYPDTSRLIPQTSETKIKVDRNQLLHTIDRAALLADREQNNVVRLDTLEENKIKISSHSPEVGQVQEEISINELEGETLNISFSSKYMLDTLRTINADEVEINFTGAMRPFIIKSSEDESVLQLILPVRTF